MTLPARQTTPTRAPSLARQPAGPVGTGGQCHLLLESVHRGRVDGPVVHLRGTLRHSVDHVHLLLAFVVANVRARENHAGPHSHGHILQGQLARDQWRDHMLPWW